MCVMLSRWMIWHTNTIKLTLITVIESLFDVLTWDFNKIKKKTSGKLYEWGPDEWRRVCFEFKQFVFTTRERPMDRIILIRILVCTNSVNSWLSWTLISLLTLYNRQDSIHEHAESISHVLVLPKNLFGWYISNTLVVKH